MSKIHKELLEAVVKQCEHNIDYYSKENQMCIQGTSDEKLLVLDSENVKLSKNVSLDKNKRLTLIYSGKKGVWIRNQIIRDWFYNKFNEPYQKLKKYLTK